MAAVGGGGAAAPHRHPLLPKSFSTSSSSDGSEAAEGAARGSTARIAPPPPPPPRGAGRRGSRGATLAGASQEQTAFALLAAGLLLVLCLWGQGRHGGAAVRSRLQLEPLEADLDDPVGLGAALLPPDAAPLGDDSCAAARNGRCDEGRRGNLTLSDDGSEVVLCDLGTDASDCGPWHGVRHGPGWREAVGPVEYLRRMGVELRARRLPHAPARLVFGHTDPARDTDQSAHMARAGVVEPGLAQLVAAALAGAGGAAATAGEPRCDARSPGARGVVVDVGANFGYYALLSAALGCRVLAFEPVAHFRAFLEWSAARNHLTSLIEVVPALVLPDVGRRHALRVPTVGQWGAAGVDVPPGPGNSSVTVTARAVRLDDFVYGGSSSGSSGSGSDDDEQQQQEHEHEQEQEQQQQGLAVAETWRARAARPRQHHLPGAPPPHPPQLRATELLARGAPIALLKVDVEGREADVFATAQRLLRDGRIESAVFEFSPGRYYGAPDQLARLPELLLSLLRRKFLLAHVPWSVAHDARPAAAARSWLAAPLPELDLVTREQLAYDVWTVQRLRNGSLPGMWGAKSWPCPEMRAAEMTMAPPGQELANAQVLFHPLAFMSSFLFNTNIFATRRPSRELNLTLTRHLEVSPDMFPQTFDAQRRWWPVATDRPSVGAAFEFGLGTWVECADVPPRWQVAQRCRCRNWDACGRHEQAVSACMKRAATGYDYPVKLPPEAAVPTAADEAAKVAAAAAAAERRRQAAADASSRKAAAAAAAAAA